jgi:hypothetical protein
MRFVIAECQDSTPGTLFLAKRPGSTLDTIWEPAQGPEDDRRHPMVVLASGLAAQDLRDLVMAFEHVYHDVQTLQMDLRLGRWLGRMTLHEKGIAGTSTHNVLSFQQSFGALWEHSEAGVVHLRAQVRDGVDADELADQMRAALLKTGIEAQVEVRELGPKDYGVWDTLVQHAIGLA